MCDCGEAPSAFVATLRRARKVHRCCECSGEIAPGQSYQYASGVWAGEPNSFKTCMPCAEDRRELEATFLDRQEFWRCIPFGGLHDEFADEPGWDAVHRCFLRARGKGAVL